MGNARSYTSNFNRSLPKLYRAIIINNPLKDPIQGRVIKKADKIVLPGVGAFPKAMELLNKTNLIPDIKNHVLKERPILGICLGMQLLFSSSEEIEETQGLDFIKGKVIKLPEKETMEKNFKIPNVGWHTIEINDKIDMSEMCSRLAKTRRASDAPARSQRSRTALKCNGRQRGLCKREGVPGGRRQRVTRGRGNS